MCVGHDGRRVIPEHGFDTLHARGQTITLARTKKRG
jgi:hypothetical protein